MPSNVVPPIVQPGMEVRPPKLKSKPRPPPPKPRDHSSELIIGEDTGQQNGGVTGIMGSSGMYILLLLSTTLLRLEDVFLSSNLPQSIG